MKNLIQKTKEIFTKQETCKTEGGVCYPAADYAVVPDRESPSTWKLRLSQTRPGNITVSQLGRAAAAFSAGGFRGNRVQLSTKEASQAKARIRREYKKLGVKDIPDSVKERQLEIWLDKEVNQYRWLAIYSNNYRDNDNPPEIISEASHRSFVKGVETGVYPYPELWLWHVPGSRIGQADWLTYTDDGFAVASGYFDKDKEHVAKELSKQQDTLVSHGMPKTFVKRDPEDETVIIQHITKEISPLPSKAAANKLTGFELLSKEESMIPEHKVPYLKAAGMTDEELEAVNAAISQRADAAKEEKLESKEETDTQETSENNTEELTLEGIAGLLKAGLTPIAEQINAIDTRVKELEKSDEEKIMEKAANTPKASLDSLLAEHVGGLFNKESQVDGRTTLAKSGPKEAATPQGVFFEPWLTPVVEEAQ
jgi:hypothetical protein